MLGPSSHTHPGPLCSPLYHKEICFPGSLSLCFLVSSASCRHWQKIGGPRKEEARASVSLAALGSISAKDASCSRLQILWKSSSTGWSWLLGSDSPTSSLPFCSLKWINIFLLLITYAFVSQSCLAPQLYHCLLWWFQNIFRSSVIFLSLKGEI